MKNKLTALAFISLLALSACGTKEYKPQDYILEMNYKDDFRILQLTDIHLSDKDDQQTQFKFLDLLYKDANNPDLVVVTGDLFTFASKGTAKSLLKYFDDKGIPWSVCFGNHDEQCYFSVDWLTETLTNYGSNCLFKDLQDDKVNGNCNYVINLMKDGKVHDQLFIMDSNRYNFSLSQLGYDCFKEDQINWYESVVKYTKEQNGGETVNSMMFYHIPLPEINKFCDVDKMMKPGDEGYNFIWGEKREKTCPPDEDLHFFDKIDELDATTGMFFGHDHINDFEAVYNDVYFCYGLKSTDRIYYDEDMLGYKLIDLKEDSTFEIKRTFISWDGKEVKYE